MLALFVSGLCACPPAAPTPTPVDAAIATVLVQPADAGAPDSGPKLCVDSVGVYHMPNPQWTPGVLCSPSDPDFAGYRYPAHVAYCQRNIGSAEKNEAARRYGIPRSDYSKYEFDHLIPLNSGGSNSVGNLWPQPIVEAREKDKVEDQAYNGLRSGKMTQDQAVELLHAWHPASCP